VAERAIGTIFNISRTMMIHAAIKWIEVISVDLWPMAVSYAVWLNNYVPKKNGLSAVELMSKIKNPRLKLKDTHVFGCPVYVLDPKLHVSGGFIPKFNPKSRRGVFVGFSDKRSSLVPLVMNLQTLTITPQFHVVFDDWFITVDSDLKFSELDDKWMTLFGEKRYQFVFDDEDNICLDKCWKENVDVFVTSVIPRGISSNLEPTFSTKNQIWMEFLQKKPLFLRENKLF
jgi:hypothetical protein